jgi:hypothetical protein
MDDDLASVAIDRHKGVVLELTDAGYRNDGWDPGVR